LLTPEVAFEPLMGYKENEGANGPSLMTVITNVHNHKHCIESILVYQTLT